MAFCICEKIKDTGLLARFHSTQGDQDVRRTRDSHGRHFVRSTDWAERETLRNMLNTLAHHERKSSSVQRFEPCYRQIYPSKKQKATFKIPKKQPYIPAVYQKRTASYRDKYKNDEFQPKGRGLQWPPLYPTKRKDYAQRKRSVDDSKGLPSWLLPLYSCKACHNGDTSSTSEARFSGGAFKRRMETIEGVKQIRVNQNVLLGVMKKKGTKKDEKKALNTERATNAVEALKRKISSMQDYLSAMKNMEVYKKKYQPRQMTNETDSSEKIVREAFSRIYQIEKPNLERELQVKNSMGLGAARPKSLGKPHSGTPDTGTEQYLESGTEVENKNKVFRPFKNQTDEVAVQNCEDESNLTNQAFQASNLANKQSIEETTNNLTVGKIQKEALVKMKQPSWKKLQNSNHSKNDETTPNQNKQQVLNTQTNQEPNQNQTSPWLPHKQGEISNSTLLNQPQSRNIRIQETKTVENEGKRFDEWTVESLKSRISVMKINNTLDGPSSNRAKDIAVTKNGGETKPKISQVALRSFHKEAGGKNSKKLQLISAVKVRVGYQRTAGRRNFSTFRPSKLAQPMTKDFTCYRRTLFNTHHNMNRRYWVSRIRRCFVLKKIKGSKCENWKNSPRDIPYEKKEVYCKSPTPILWKSKDLVDNHQESKVSNPPRIMLGQTVNPAVLNAEQRILASLSRLITTKPPPETSQDPTADIGKKIRRAKNKVNLMPWLKRSKSNNTTQKLPQIPGLNNKLANEEPHESGYEWILKNRDMVEELKRQSQFAAGKPLVPAEVKHSINQYKLPLKAEISQYRRKIDLKCAGHFCMPYTPKRWYSTCSPRRKGGILSCSDLILNKTCGIKTVEPHKKNPLPSKSVIRKTRSNVALRPNLKQYQEIPNTSRDNGTTSENSGEEQCVKKWTWKVPNKTRAFAPKTTTLTSPSKVLGTRMSEMSSCALKKQVEELKCLIKRAREQVTEKINESPTEPQLADKYEARLKRLVKAAHINAQKMQIVEPKYTSENNMMTKKSSNAKKNPAKMMESTGKTDDSKCQPEASLLKSLFKQKNEDAETFAKEIIQRNNLASLPALASKKKAEKTINKVYLKLKLLVEAVRKKSAVLDPTNDVRLLPTNSLERSVGMDLMPHPSPIILVKKDKAAHTVETKNVIKEPSYAVNVELKAANMPAPQQTIQLWKGESKPKEFHFPKEREPTYGDLLMLFTKAKELFYYQFPEEHNTTHAKLEKTAISNDQHEGVENNKPSYDEMNKNWLSTREDVSRRAKAVSEPNKDSSKEGENIPQACSSLQAETLRNSGVNTLDCTMTKSKIIPLGMIKSDKVCCDGIWSGATTKVQEDEDICEKPQTSSTDQLLRNKVTAANSVISPLTNQIHAKTVVCQTVNHTKQLLLDIKSNQQESQTFESPESTKPLFQKPLAAWESQTKSFSNGVGKSASSARQEIKTVNDVTHQQGTTGASQDFQGEISNWSDQKMGHFHISNQPPSTSVGDKTSKCLHEMGYNQELIKYDKTILDSTEKGASKSDDQYIKDCVDSMKTLEDNVKKYESYYRDYFTTDTVSGYDHLYQVYDSLSKLNGVVQYQRMDTQLKLEVEARKGAFASVPQNTPEKARQLPINSSLGKQPFPTEIREAETIDQHVIKSIGTSRTQPSNWPGSSSNESMTGVSSQELELEQEPAALAHPSVTGQQRNQNSHSGSEQAEPVINKKFLQSSGNIKEGIQAQKTEVSYSDNMRIPTNVESHPNHGSRDTLPQVNGANSKGKSTNYEELLTQDPTLNLEVVKNLKLPVILSETCHTEKNWFNKFYSDPHRKR